MVALHEAISPRCHADRESKIRQLTAGTSRNISSVLGGTTLVRHETIAPLTYQWRIQELRAIYGMAQGTPARSQQIRASGAPIPRVAIKLSAACISMKSWVGSSETLCPSTPISKSESQRP